MTIRTIRNMAFTGMAVSAAAAFSTSIGAAGSAPYQCDVSPLWANVLYCSLGGASCSEIDDGTCWDECTTRSMGTPAYMPWCSDTEGKFDCICPHGGE
jgi:hypothetical protein